MVQEGSCGLVLKTVFIGCLFLFNDLLLQVVATRGAHLLGLCPLEFLWIVAFSSGFAGAASD